MKQDLVFNKISLEDNNILIKKFIKGIEGGRTLDVTDYTEEVIKAGHVIVQKANGDYAPLAVEDGAYKATEGAYLAEGEKYAGMLVSSILAKAPAAAIMTWGIVNEEALPYAVPADFKTAMPHIDYQIDEEA